MRQKVEPVFDKTPVTMNNVNRELSSHRKSNLLFLTARKLEQTGLGKDDTGFTGRCLLA